MELHEDLSFHYQGPGQIQAVSEAMQKVNGLEESATPEPIRRSGRDPGWPVEFQGPMEIGTFNFALDSL